MSQRGLSERMVEQYLSWWIANTGETGNALSLCAGQWVIVL
ncbi:hypothetical protein P3T20_007158 [Paraburkholderia sp. GAS206C]